MRKRLHVKLVSRRPPQVPGQHLSGNDSRRETDLRRESSCSEMAGAPDTIRTCGLCLRRATLYPAELRVRGRVYSLGRSVLQPAIQPNRSWHSSSASTRRRPHPGCCKGRRTRGRWRRRPDGPSAAWRNGCRRAPRCRVLSRTVEMSWAWAAPSSVKEKIAPLVAECPLDVQPVQALQPVAGIVAQGLAHARRCASIPSPIM